MHRGRSLDVSSRPRHCARRGLRRSSTGDSPSSRWSSKRSTGSASRICRFLKCTNCWPERSLPWRPPPSRASCCRASPCACWRCWGIAPPLDHCVRCGAALPPGAVWLALGPAASSTNAAASAGETSPNWRTPISRTFARAAQGQRPGATASRYPAGARAVEELVAHRLGRRPRRYHASIASAPRADRRRDHGLGRRQQAPSGWRSRIPAPASRCPVTTIERTNRKRDLEEIAGHDPSYQVDRLVVGDPVTLSGERGPAAQQVDAFVRECFARSFRVRSTEWTSA